MELSLKNIFTDADVDEFFKSEDVRKYSYQGN